MAPSEPAGSGRAARRGGDGAAHAAVMDADIYRTDAFRMNAFKVLSCSNRAAHDWRVALAGKGCPFAHPGEHARRRPLDKFKYGSEMCPFARAGKPCPSGDGCAYSHHCFESYLHPDRYRTQMCCDGDTCSRPVCFFAHSLAELRVPQAPQAAGAWPPQQVQSAPVPQGRLGRTASPAGSVLSSLCNAAGAAGSPRGSHLASGPGRGSLDAGGSFSDLSGAFGLPPMSLSSPLLLGGAAAGCQGAGMVLPMLPAPPAGARAPPQLQPPCPADALQALVFEAQAGSRAAAAAYAAALEADAAANEAVGRAVDFASRLAAAGGGSPPLAGSPRSAGAAAGLLQLPHAGGAAWDGAAAPPPLLLPAGSGSASLHLAYSGPGPAGSVLLMSSPSMLLAGTELPMQLRHAW
ncbi:hypothetical protein Rsub_07610 [Raphidocelis subcapitata]|uniref:C3H1-type domain-containing protein n=1 Tax=Raphidocelis subcapitata TaxID=307507 RepID=A0A2V0PC28_9CHLO|nr:hypothetical protein Rsub_07610 [Raphidocelis subcapitata]|eukprot:GBF94727.1 hypothetical protein Rsub_07610 [Raphidocelis subcapitata]